ARFSGAAGAGRGSHRARRPERPRDGPPLALRGPKRANSTRPHELPAFARQPAMNKSDQAFEDPRLGLLRARVRDVPDFPKPGILFRDLTPLMADGAALQHAVALLAERLRPHQPEAILAVES